MNHVKLFRLLTIAAVAINFGFLPIAQAADASKVPAPASKSKKKPAIKKSQPEAKGSACVFNNKKWSGGTHCMKSCNDKGTSCDMQICREGEWKPYSSCFGPHSVAPNCPPSCG